MAGAESTARAATNYWTASGGNKTWNSAGNWSLGHVPTSTEDVVLDNGQSDNDLQINANVDVLSFTIQNGYKRAVAPTGAQTIRVRGNFTLGGSGNSGFTGSTVSTQIDGTLTVTTGTFTASGGTLSIGGGLSVVDTFTGSSGAITVGGTLSVSGAGRYTAGTGELTAGAFSISGGQFNGGSSSIRFLGNVSISGGTLTASSGTTRIGGAFSRTAGTFTHNNGTVIFNASSTPPGSHVLGSSTFSTVKVADGLVGYWSLDEGTGTTATDYGTGASNGTFTNTSGAPWVTSGLPSAITFGNPAAGSFDGVNDYLDIPSAVVATNDSFSACSWVNFNAIAASSPSDSQTIISIDPQTSPTGTQASPFILQYRGDMSGVFGATMVQTNSTSATQDNVYATAFGRPSAGSWYHVCATYDSSTSNLYLYVNGTSYGPTTHSTTWAGTGHTLVGTEWWGARQHYLNGKTDDVRIYNRALSSTQVAALYAGGRPAGATHTFSDAFTVNTAFQVVEGTVINGAATQTMSGGLSVYPNGVLTLSAAGTLAIGSGQTLAMNGTLNASNSSATIKSSTGSYVFQVGNTAWARPTLNITGLTVQNTNTNGMFINSNTSAVTTFTRFDNIAFSAGTGAQLLQIYATSLYLSSSGCTFDAGVTATTTNSVRLTGNGTADGGTRVVFGGSTCASSFTSCQASKADDDSNSDGVPSTPATNGAVVQFVRAAGTDTAGTIEGFPTAAFDWNTFTYYSTYVAFHDVSGTVDRIYVRDQTGAARYAWDTPSGETIVGTPRWNTSGGTHYVYVALASGKVYRLVDSGSSLVADTGWTTNPYDCSCTIISGLAMDANNLYWTGTASGNKIWTLGQSSASVPFGSPLTITPALTSSTPAQWTSSGTTYLFLGTAGHLLKVDVTNQTLSDDNTNPGSASVSGRITIGTNATNRILAGDEAGIFWSIDPANFSGTNKQWSYAVAGDSIKSAPYYDYQTNTVQFGTEAGKVVALNASGTAMTGYPYTPGSGDVIRNAMLYYGGVIAVGTTTGKLYFIDRNNGTSGPALIRTYDFGPTESVSGVGYDVNGGRYMVTTSNATTKDGRLYYIDVIADPTSGSS